MDVLMPQLGETVAEGKITKWLKSPGEAVAPGDNLFEVETDKVTVEVPSIVAGVLATINVEAGAVAPVGAIVAVVSAEGEKPGAARTIPPQPAAVTGNNVAAPATVATPKVSPRRTLDPFREVDTPRQNFGSAHVNGAAITPLARRLAGNASLDIRQIKGSGPRGRITGRDVEQAIAARGATSAPGMRPAEIETPVPEIYLRRPHKVVPVDGMRRTVAARLAQAKTTIPHFYLTAHIEVGRLARIRAEINESAPKGADGAPAYKLSINDFLVKALALALQDVPAANAIWTGDGILAFEHSDVAVAVAVPGGLFTPVVQSAETKPIAAISAEVKSLAERARQRALRPEEYQGGSTTISNLGMHDIEEFSAIINPPQATILAVGATHRHPIEIEGGGIAFIDRMTATLSCDHRVVDGVLGAELLRRFKSLIENPFRMLV